MANLRFNARYANCCGTIAVVVLGLGFLSLGTAANHEQRCMQGCLKLRKSRVIDALKELRCGRIYGPSDWEIYWSPTGGYHSSRMTLAAQGLPASAASGYEQLDSIQMGSSRTVEAARLKQSQEVELARSMASVRLIWS